MNEMMMGSLMLVAALVLALPAALYGTRLSILGNRKRRGEQLNERERKLLKKNAALALVLFVAVYGLVFKSFAMFK